MMFLGKDDIDRSEPQIEENRSKELKNKKLEARNQVFRIHTWQKRRLRATLGFMSGQKLGGRFVFKIRENYKMMQIAEQRGEHHVK